MRRKILALIVCAAVALGAAGEARADKFNCNNPAYKKGHAAECKGVGTGFGFPGGDDDPQDGLLGIIRRVLDRIL